MAIGRYRVKPSAVTPLLNWQSELLDRIAFITFLNESGGDALELVSGRTLTKGSSSAKANSLYGKVAVFDGTANSAYTNANLMPFARSGGTSTGDITMMFFGAITATAANISAIIGQSNTADSICFAFFGNAGPSFATTSGALMIDCGNSGDDLVTANSMLDGTYHVYVGRRLNGTLTLFRDGVSQGTVASVRDVQGSGVQLRIGNNPTDGATQGNIAFAAGWNRGLSDNEVQRVTGLLWDAFLQDDLDGLNHSIANADVTNTPAEFGFEAKSAALSRVVAINVNNTPTTLNPADKSASITLSADNLSVSIPVNDPNDPFVRATTSITSGKFFGETQVVFTTTNDTGVGLANATEALTHFLGQTTNSIAVYPQGSSASEVYYNNAITFHASPIATGDWVGWAIDRDNNKLYIRAGFLVNGSYTWNNNDGSDPSTNTGGYDISGITGALFPGISITRTDNSATLNFGVTKFRTLTSLPTGYAPYGGPIIKNQFEAGSPTLTAAVTVSLTPQSAKLGFEVNVDASAPLFITADNQVVDGLTIIATGSSHGIRCLNFSGVIIRNCIIYHQDGHGISFDTAPNITITNNNFIKTNSPQTGANVTQSNNIDGFNSSNPTIGGVTANLGNRVENGSAGVYLLQCSTPHVLYLEGHNIRGPSPRGQLVQLNNSPNGEIRHFSVVNDLSVSWTEDNINIFDSPNTAISDGVIDGNNSPSGDGVIIETTSDNCTVDSVDVIHWGNGAFASSNSSGAIFTNCRTDLWHANGGRGLSSSNGLTFASFNGASGTSFDSSNIYGTSSSTNIIFDITTMTNHNPTGPLAFTARSPLALNVPTGKAVSVALIRTAAPNFAEFGYETSTAHLGTTTDFDTTRPDPSVDGNFGFTVSPINLQPFIAGFTSASRIVHVMPTTDRAQLLSLYASFQNFPSAGIDRIIYSRPFRRVVNVVGGGVPGNLPNVTAIPLFDVRPTNFTSGFETDGAGDLQEFHLMSNNPEFGFEIADVSTFQLHSMDIGKPEFGFKTSGALQIVQSGVRTVSAEFGVEVKSATLLQKSNLVITPVTTGWETFGALNISQSGTIGLSNPNIAPTTDLRNWTFLVGGSAISRNATNTADGHFRYDLTATAGRSGNFENMVFVAGQQYAISIDAVGTVPFQFNFWTGANTGSPPNSDNQNSPTFTPTGTTATFTWVFTATAPTVVGQGTSMGIVYNNLSGTLSGTTTLSQFKVEHASAATIYVDPIPVSQTVGTSFTKGSTITLPMSTFQISGDAITSITTSGFGDLTFTVNVAAQTITIGNITSATTGLKSGTFKVAGAFGNVSNQSNMSITLNAVGTGRLYANSVNPGSDDFRWAGETSGWMHQRIDMIHGFTDRGDSFSQIDRNWNPTPHAYMMTSQYCSPGDSDTVNNMNMTTAANGGYNSFWLSCFQAHSAIANKIAVVRIWQECNQPSFPWSTNTSNRATFIAAWRNHAQQVRIALPNAKIDWNLNEGGSGGAGSVNGFDLYPGDDLVDIISIDSYARFAPNMATDPAGQITGNSVVAFAQTHGKLFGIGEYAAWQCGTGYITSTAALCDSIGATCAYQSYYDQGTGNNGGNTIITGNPDSCGTTLQDEWNNSSFGTKPYGGTWSPLI